MKCLVETQGKKDALVTLTYQILAKSQMLSGNIPLNLGIIDAYAVI